MHIKIRKLKLIMRNSSFMSFLIGLILFELIVVGIYIYNVSLFSTFKFVNDNDADEENNANNKRFVFDFMFNNNNKKVDRSYYDKNIFTDHKSIGFNMNIFQFSTIIVNQKQSNDILIESNGFLFDHTFEDFVLNNNKIKFYIRLNKKNGFVIKDPVELMKHCADIDRHDRQKCIFTVKTLLTKSDLDLVDDLNNLKVALIDMNFIEIYLKVNDPIEKMINFDNEPNKVYVNEDDSAKKQSIINCNPKFISNLGSDLLNYIDLQFELGYERMVFNFESYHNYDLDDLFLLEQLKGYNVDLNLIENFNRTTFCNPKVGKFLYQNCLNASRAFSIPNIDNYLTNLLEKSFTIECYLTHKYEYELISNLDQNEIIFPREFEINQYNHKILNSSNNQQCLGLINKDLKYDLYTHFKSLAKNDLFEDSSLKSCYSFEMVLFYLKESTEFMQKSNLTSSFSSIIDCLNVTMNNMTAKNDRNSKLTHQIFNTYFGLMSDEDNKLFKSIYDTNLADSIGIDEDMDCFKVPFKYGNLNNFKYSSYLNQPANDPINDAFSFKDESSSSFLVDLEYYVFFVNNFINTNTLNYEY